jgi:hypothetical protein
MQLSDIVISPNTTSQKPEKGCMHTTFSEMPNHTLLLLKRGDSDDLIAFL